MEYSNAELTQRVKQLEDIVLGLMYQFGHVATPQISTICVNNSLHSHSVYTPPEDMREHPSGLLVPHHVWQPAIDWGRDMIHLHPDNKPRA